MTSVHDGPQRRTVDNRASGLGGEHGEDLSGNYTTYLFCLNFQSVSDYTTFFGLARNHLCFLFVADGTVKVSTLKKNHRVKKTIACVQMFFFLWSHQQHEDPNQMKKVNVVETRKKKFPHRARMQCQRMPTRKSSHNEGVFVLKIKMPRDRNTNTVIHARSIEHDRVTWRLKRDVSMSRHTLSCRLVTVLLLSLWFCMI